MPFSKQLFSNFCEIPLNNKEMSNLVATNFESKYEDDVMECLQFGICSFTPASQRVIL